MSDPMHADHQAPADAVSRSIIEAGEPSSPRNGVASPHRSETSDVQNGGRDCDVYACFDCGLKLRANTEENTVVHKEETPYACDICSYGCIQTGDQKFLIPKSLFEPKQYFCASCPYMTQRKVNLVHHSRIHTGEKPYACCKCDYSSTHPTNLKRHLKTHFNYQVRPMDRQKQYSCNECNYKTDQKSALKKHLRCHTGEKPYSCSICEYRSSHPSQITIHKRTHSGEKPFKCNVCKYKTTHRSNLDRHSRTHTGQKPYACDACDYRASVKCTLLAHMKKTHGRS